jgi:hypothetical protein
VIRGSGHGRPETPAGEASPPRWRSLVYAIINSYAVADLSMIPVWRFAPPRLPAWYAFLKLRNPGVRILEIPYVLSG